VTRTAGERSLLARAASRPSTADAGIARAAVLLARTECPDADPDRVEAGLVALAGAARRRGVAASSAGDRVRVLAEVLAGERGLRGDRERYDDPRNSCLECVLDRRTGIPLSLSLLWMETGRLLGWRVEGVGLPGHFVVRVHGRDGGSAMADPFHGGGVLTRARARDLLRELHGRPVRIGARDLAPVRPRDALLRMLRNLRASYRRRGDRERALSVAEDMLLLAPGLPEALRDRGMLRLEGGDRDGAKGDLREFLAAPGRTAPGTAAEVARLLHSLTDDAELPN
jgi:regulator of sirC expression with transglutaminase-like and TPR domain